MSNITEQQQYEQLVNWLKENKLSLILCLIISFGGVGGWSYWKNHQSQQQQTIAEVFATNKISATQENSVQAFDNLIKEYPNSIYANLASINKVKLLIANKNFAEAETVLVKALNNTHDATIKNIIKLRLAKIQLQLQKYDIMIANLESIDSNAFDISKNKLLGDAWFAKQQKEKAKEFYNKALSLTSKASAEHDLMQMQINNL